MTAADDTRKLATILAIDVVGYSAAAERDQVGAARQIAALRARIGELAAEHGGRLFHTAGDGFMLEFPLASAGVRAAIALLEDASIPDSALPHVRAGAHLGEVMIEGDDLLGHGVNVAARLVAQAEPGALVISDAVKTQIHGEIVARFTPLGPVHLPKLRESVLVHTYSPSAPRLDLRQQALALAKRRWRVLAIGASALAGAATAAGVMATRSVSYVLEPMQMVAHSARHEMYPALTPDGRFVVYMVELGDSYPSNTDLFMRSLAGGEPTQLTDTPGWNEGHSAFSPAGDRLAYARWLLGARRIEGEDICDIVVRVFPNGADRRVASCGFGISRLTWTSDGKSLVFGRPSETGGEETNRLVQLNLETGEVLDLVPPLARGMGDMNATISPDGARVAFVRYRSAEIGDAYVYDLERQRLTRVTDDGTWAQLAWADSRNLFIMTNPDDDTNTELRLRRADGRGSGQLLLPGLANLTRPTTASGVIAFQVETSTINLWRSEAGARTAITNGNQDDFSPDFTAEGVLAYISAQSGNWIYLQTPGEPPRRLVEATGFAPRGLRWSPDGRQLAYSATTDRRTGIFIVDVDSGVIQPVPVDGNEDMANPTWSPDGRSLVVARASAAGPLLMRVRLDSAAPPQPISGPGWHEAIETPEGLFAISRTEPGIWRLAPGRAPELVLPEFRPEIDNAVLVTLHDWTVANGGFYFAEWREGSEARIFSRAIDGGETRRVVDVDGLFAGSIAVDPQTGGIVYGVAVEQFDIGVMRYRRR